MRNTDTATTATKIVFDTETCTRCGGTGDYPSAAWQGMCLKCKRAGVVYTPTAKRARAAMDAWAEQNLSTTYGQLVVGDKFMDGRKVREVVSIEDDRLNPGRIAVTTKAMTIITEPQFGVRRAWTRETLQEMAQAVLSRRKGWRWE